MEGVITEDMRNAPIVDFEIDGQGYTIRAPMIEERFRTLPTAAMGLFKGMKPRNFYAHPGIYGELFLKKPLPLDSWLRCRDLAWLPQTVVPDWKQKILYFHEQVGIFMDKEGIVLPGSSFPIWLNRCIFGCQSLPVELINNFIWKWKKEPQGLQYLRIGFKEKAIKKKELAARCFAGVRHEEVWSPLRQDIVSYSKEDFCSYVIEIGANRNHSAVFVTLSEDDTRLLVIAIGYHHLALHAVSLTDEGDYFALLFTINFITNIWRDIHLDKDRLQQVYRRIRNNSSSF